MISVFYLWVWDLFPDLPRGEGEQKVAQIKETYLENKSFVAPPIAIQKNGDHFSMGK